VVKNEPMNTCSKNLSVSIALINALCLTVGQHLSAQTFTTLHNFSGVDGASPRRLTLWGGVLYGPTERGGASGNGTIFAINTNGTGFATLHDFNGAPNDGSDPFKGLVLGGRTLWGTTYSGGRWGSGTVFGMDTNGTDFSILYSFTGGSDGSEPAGVVLSDSSLYGAATAGASGPNGGNGTIFAMNPGGSGFETLYSFQGGIDGTYPDAAVIVSGNSLYGTALEGGNGSPGTVFGGNGTVFAENTDGTGFRTLHVFSYGSGPGNFGNIMNLDGASPSCALVLAGNTLFGTARGGGTAANGTVFSLNTDGSGFTTLYSFSPLDAATGTTNSDGAVPFAGLALAGDTLYGTTTSGGSRGNGTIFAINTNGSRFTTLYSFTATSGTAGTNSDGADPREEVIFWGNTLYGTALAGGTSGNGTIFSLSLAPVTPPELTIVSSAGNIVLSWPSSVTGLNLQSATNFISPAWAVVSKTPVVVNSLNTVTNPITGSQQFFRLSQ
jgi:uncharacterized repeat protein (TIGR03803 family)